MDDRESRIRQRAYEIWDHQGRPRGRAEAHWEQSCREIDAEDAANAQDFCRESAEQPDREGRLFDVKRSG